MKRSEIVWIVVISVLFVAAISIRSILLGGSSVTTLRPADALSGQVSQALATGATPVPGKDFKLTGTTYFENNTWAVTHIDNLTKTGSGGYAILQKRSGMFQVVLGPGTSFAYSYVRNVPPSVGAYLSQLGVVYESTN